MIIRKVALAVVTIAAFSPVISQAAPDKTSVQACARAFATSLAAPGAEAPPYKVAYHRTASTSLLDYYPSDYTMTLEAYDSKTGAAVGRASCTTNYRGEVTGLSAIPLNATAATLASGF